MCLAVCACVGAAGGQEFRPVEAATQQDSWLAALEQLLLVHAGREWHSMHGSGRQLTKAAYQGCLPNWHQFGINTTK